MELINDDDDLQNQSIKINDDRSPSSIGNNPQNDSGAVSNFINGFKNFIKPKIKSTDIEKDNQQSNSLDSDINTSQITNSSISADLKEESCKDRIANKIINTVEVERNIGVFVALIGIGSVIICISLFLIPFIITSPKKFSFCFAVGSIFILASFLFLVGTRKFVTKLFENKRLFISITFILSIFVGIGFSLGRHYFISLLCSLMFFF